MYWQDFQRGGMGRVHHVRNGGEVQVLTPAQGYYVDGFDQQTKTVLNFTAAIFTVVRVVLRKNEMQEEIAIVIAPWKKSIKPP